MLQKLNNLRLPIGYNESDIKASIRKKIGDYEYIKLDKLSLDCRRKNDIHYNASVVVKGKVNPKLLVEYIPKKTSCSELKYSGIKKIKNPIVIGSGPSGLFCALVLAENGLNPIIFERGDRVENRREKVNIFSCGGSLDENTNIQFGEGGAGTFSDGKLNTGISSEYISIVLNEFVKHGAFSNILYDAKPHIGTDILQNVVKSMRQHIEKLGGKFYFNTKVDSVLIESGKVRGIIANNEKFFTDNIVLACGHSARDTIRMLYDLGVNMEAKSFAVGMRVEHKQEMLDIAQYGKVYDNLPPSDYKLSHRLSNGKGCFTFCMCPGGYVVPAMSEEFTVVTNGMSEQRRDNKFCNSAVLVGVDPSDYGSKVLDGFAFQEKIEKLAYNVAKNYSAPSILVKDFISGNKSKCLDSIETSYTRGLASSTMENVLPKFILDGMREGLVAFGKKVRNFDKEGVLIGVESRSSSPVRVLRGENYMSNIEGLYPAGEGAGYAGGITSSAVDGIKVALKLIENNRK